MSSSNIDNSSNRQILIFEWLKTSKYTCPLKENKGFYICGGQIVRLKSGERIDLLDWLKREGFHTLKRIYNHSISYTGPNKNYQEKITFFNSEFRNDKYYEENKKREEFEESCKPDPHYDGGSIVDNWLNCHKAMEYDYQAVENCLDLRPFHPVGCFFEFVLLFRCSCFRLCCSFSTLFAPV